MSEKRDDKIDTFVDALEFASLMLLADIVGVENEDDGHWLDDDYPEKECECRDNVATEIKKAF